MSELRADTRNVEVRRGRETVLLVEDRDDVREITRRMLSDLGYTVITATSAENALSTFNGHSTEIQALVTDVMMPGKNGCQLAQELLAINPGLRVLYVSGHPGELLANQGLQEGEHFLSKPFTSQTLGVKMREMLDH